MIFFPWDREQRRFKGERVFSTIDEAALAASGG